MDAEHWERIAGLFASASELPEEDREGFLSRKCGENEELHAQVAGLLDESAEAEAYFARMSEHARLLLDHDEGDREDRVIGAYRIRRAIGRGGMGTVYLAERTDGEFEHQVALKVLRRGLDTDDLLQRFRAERQILASLRHPHIAHLIDGGSTEDGLPYLVMEYVEGEPITDYCAKHTLGVDDRLGLFLAVADAVQHAHDRGVVHRDIKPGNILVTEDGTPKLLDFGIAKLLDDGHDDVLTRTGLRLMTPSYASPEQVRGETITPATDVYALGVLLYVILTGRTPHELTGRGTTEIERIICDEMPPPPSATKQSVTNGAGPVAGRKIARRLRGDLDVIVLKALRKEPERRYRSVSALADDIRRHLSGRPVAARPDRFSYRVGKFVQRHPVLAAVSALVLVAALGYGIMLHVHTQHIEAERDRAQLEAARASEVTEFLVGLFDPAPFAVAGRDTITARDLVEHGTAALQDDLHDQPLVRAQLLATVGRIHSLLGLHEEAEQQLTEALALQRQHGESEVEVGHLLLHLGRVLNISRGFARSEPILREAWEIFRNESADHSLGMARTGLSLATALYQQGRLDEAEKLLTEVLQWLRGSDLTTDPAYHSALLTQTAVHRRQGNAAEAEAIYRRILAAPKVMDYENTREHAMVDLASLLAEQGNLAEAESLYRDVLTDMRARLGDGHRSVGTLRGNLAGVLYDQGLLDEVEDVLHEQLEAVQQHLPPDHWRIASAHSTLGRHFVRIGDPGRAEPWLREAVDRYRHTLGDDHPWTGRERARLAGALIDLERENEARRLLSIAESALGPRDDEPGPQTREARALIDQALSRMETPTGDDLVASSDRH